MMSDYAVAFDIGTTTIHAEFFSIERNESLEIFTAFNEQRIFGVDVISRIGAVQNGKLHELFSVINNQVEGILRHFISKHKIDKITKCAVSGNTTMLHIFCGEDPSRLGRAPYTPLFLNEKQFKGSELSLSAECITLLPGVSAFIGADIVSGLAYVDIMGNNENNALFIDIGTNGEIALYKKNEKKIYCCSTAAGPCFEEISCGLSASEFIDTIAEMRRGGIIDETGALHNVLADEYKNACQKDVRQSDVRQFQLAKSAIFSGIKLICKHAHVKLGDLGTVYIAGGLGEHLNLQNAAYVGLLPREFADMQAANVHICGNTSLKGTGKYLTDLTFSPRLCDIIACAQTVDLAGDKFFAAAFEHNMWF